MKKIERNNIINHNNYLTILKQQNITQFIVVYMMNIN